MKKCTKLVTSALFALTVGASLAACGNSNGGNEGGCLNITYYPGGYGADWLEKFTKEYLAEVKGTTPDQIKAGTDYKLKPDSSITYGVTQYLKSNKNCPDIVISNAIQASDVSAGLIADLNDVYNSEITKMDGSKIKLRDYIMPEVMERFSLQYRYGQGDRLPFALPWSAIPLSMAYNETLLNKIEHHDSSYLVHEDAIVNGKWARAPKTVNELKACFLDIDEYNKGQETPVSKFGWAVDGANWFECLYMTWWAEAQGLDTSKVSGEGSYYDFWNFETPDIYKQTGIQTALETVKSLIVKDGEFANCIPNVKQSSIKTLQDSFAKGEIVFCLTGDFFENEYKSVIEKYNQTFKMAAVPSISDNLDTPVNVPLTTQSAMFVAKNAKNKDLAKGLLLYMCNEAQLVEFTETTGGLRPFDYNPLTLDPTFEFSPFKKSTLQLYYNADDYLLKFPRNVNSDDISPIYIYKGVADNIFYGKDYLNIISELRNHTPYEIMVSGYEGYKSVYQSAEKDFAEWYELYGL